VIGQRACGTWAYRVIAAGLRRITRLLPGSGRGMRKRCTKLAGNAAHKANRTLPQTGKRLPEAAEADAAEEARHGGSPQPRASARPVL
jgi:hypothetical protein